MVDRLERFGVAVICVTILAGWGCWNRGPSRLHPPGISASGAGSGAMEQYDTNSDGKVCAEELDKAPALKAALKNLDKDGDGCVSADEVTARVEAWQDSRIGRMSFSCSVTRNGKPLAGATVNFVPEKYLGDELKGCTGTTDKNGVAVLTIPDADPPGTPDADPPGVACGLYLVEISKKEGGTETVPAQYNSQTTLGQEASQDAENVEMGVTYDLKY